MKKKNVREEKQRLLRIKWRFTSKMVDKYLNRKNIMVRKIKNEYNKI